MTRHLIYSAFILLTHSVYAQKNNLAKTPPGVPTIKEMEAEERNHNCIKINYISFTSRLKKYPFNLTAQIQFISFEGGLHSKDEVMGKIVKKIVY